MTRLTALLTAFLVSPLAHAGGFSYTGPGTRALGRAGAFAARGDDPTTLDYNPALLTLATQPQVLVNSHIGFFHSCISRSGNYTDNVTIHDISRFGDSELASGQGGYAQERFPTVCNQGPPIPNPAIAATVPLTPRVALGFGVMIPMAEGMVRFGNADGTVKGVTGELRPNPLRYMAIKTGGLALNPSVGVGVKANDWLRLGATFEWGMTALDVVSYGVATGGESPSLDGRAQMKGRDYFIPALVLGAHATLPAGFEFASAFRWSDDLRGSADIDMTFGTFGSSQPGSTAPSANTLRNLSMRMPMPWAWTTALRYVSRGPTPRSSNGDRTSSLPPRKAKGAERWDVELDAVYEFNGRVNEAVVTPADGTSLTTKQVLSNGNILQVDVPVDNAFHTPRGWKNQLSLRLGSDYALIEERLTVRAGVSYETRGVEPAFATTDILPGRRLGIHLGGTMRVTSHVDVSVAYVHLFQETIDTTANGRDGTAALPQMSADGTGRVINSGVFRASWDIVSLGATYLF